MTLSPEGAAWAGPEDLEAFVEAGLLDPFGPHGHLGTAHGMPVGLAGRLSGVVLTGRRGSRHEALLTRFLRGHAGSHCVLTPDARFATLCLEALPRSRERATLSFAETGPALSTATFDPFSDAWCPENPPARAEHRRRLGEILIPDGSGRGATGARRAMLALLALQEVLGQEARLSTVADLAGMLAEAPVGTLRSFLGNGARACRGRPHLLASQQALRGMASDPGAPALLADLARRLEGADAFDPRPGTVELTPDHFLDADRPITLVVRHEGARGAARAALIGAALRLRLGGREPGTLCLVLDEAETLPPEPEIAEPPRVDRPGRLHTIAFAESWAALARAWPESAVERLKTRSTFRLTIAPANLEAALPILDASGPIAGAGGVPPIDAPEDLGRIGESAILQLQGRFLRPLLLHPLEQDPNHLLTFH